MQVTINKKTLVIVAVISIFIAISVLLIKEYKKRQHAVPPAELTTEFKPPPRTQDLSGFITDKLATAQPPAKDVADPPKVPTGRQPVPMVPTPAELERLATQELQNDPVLAYLNRYGTPVSKQSLPVGGLTAWTVMGKAGKPVQLYTTADGLALFSGVVWDLHTGQNMTELTSTKQVVDTGTRSSMNDATATLKSNLVTGRYKTPAAFDGIAPVDVPEAIRLVDELSGVKEGKGGPADTLYVIIDPRCPYCRRAYLNTREHVKNGATIKWIPTAALGQPEVGLALAATILRANSADAVERVLGKHEMIATPPTDSELKQLANSTTFMFEAFKQNNEDNPGVPVAFFIDRRTGKARMMTGISEQVVIDDILGNPKK